MEDTNPQGSAKTVDEAAAKIFGMLDPQQPEEGQVEEMAQESEDSYQEPEQQTEEVVEEQEPPKYRVKVDNDEVEVTLDELLKGYSRTSDYTKKTQTLAEQRKAVEAERARIEEAARLRDQYAQRLSVVEQILNQQPEENLAELKENDPIQYAVKVAERAEREKQLAAVRQERMAIAARQQAEQQERLKNHLASEADKLKSAIPDLADEAKGEVVRKEIRDFAKSIGFSDQELAQVYDHRAVLTLYEAMQWRKLQQGKIQSTKKVADAPKMLKSGTSGKQTTADEQALAKMRQKLAKSGDRKDAARLFEQFL